MTTNEKIKSLQSKFGLSEEHFCQILECSGNRFKNLKNGTCEPTDEEYWAIENVFGLNKYDMTSERVILGELTMKIPVNMKKYKNIFSAYIEILKEYYNEPWEVYVLARVREITEFERFKEKFFGSKKKKSQNDEVFTPNYLAVKKEVRLLINISDGMLEVTEVPEESKEKRFRVGHYRYLRANRLELNKPKDDEITYY